MRSECVYLGLLVVIAAAGCATTPTSPTPTHTANPTLNAIPTPTADPDAPAVTAAAATRGYSPGEVRLGRDLFIARCGECHELHTPSSRTEDDWNSVLPTMTRRAKLGKDDARRVEAYVLSAMDAAAKDTSR